MSSEALPSESQLSQQLIGSSEALLEWSNALQGNSETRVVVCCNYCSSFRSLLNSDTWEPILAHVLPVCKEELQTTFYGDLAKHFIRSTRIQVHSHFM
jgi:hypothetical protein